MGLTPLVIVLPEGLEHLPSWLTLVGFVLTWFGTFIWGYSRDKERAAANEERYTMIQKSNDGRFAELKKVDDEIQNEVKDLHQWGMNSIAERADYNEKHYLTIERFDEAITSIRRRLDEIKILDLSRRLARIEGLLEQLLRERA